MDRWICIQYIYIHQTLPNYLKMSQNPSFHPSILGTFRDVLFGAQPLDLRTADRSRSCAFPKVWPRRKWQNKARPPQQLGVDMMDVMDVQIWCICIHTHMYIYMCVCIIYIYSIKYIIIWNDIIVCQIMSHYSKKCASRVRIDKQTD